MTGLGLSVSGVTVRFDGLLALDDVSLDAPQGSITGLIGPNGAGKSTLFNVCSGLVTPTAGSVTLGGQDLDRLGAAERARSGLGRTFQQTALFEDMTARENLEVCIEALDAGRSPIRQVLGRPRRRAAVTSAATEALETCGLAAVAVVPAGSLSTGQRRLLELARAVACAFPMLILDEPTSGLDPSDTQMFGSLLASTSAERGVGVLLVEHDIAFVMGLCTRLYVLDAGRLICSGSPEEVSASAEVRAAYLGGPVGRNEVA